MINVILKLKKIKKDYIFRFSDLKKIARNIIIYGTSDIVLKN